MNGKLQNNLNKQDILKWIIVISYVFFLYNLSYFLGTFERIGVIITPILYGFILAYIMNPLIMKVEKLVIKITKNKYKNGLAIIISYILLTLFCSGFILIVVPKVLVSLNMIVQSLPKLIPMWLETLENEFAFILEGLDLGDTFNITDTLKTSLIEKYNADIIIEYVVGFTKNMSTLAVNLLLGFIISIYMVLNKDMYRSKIKKIVYAYLQDSNAEKIMVLMNKIHMTFSNFLITKIINSIIIGILTYFGCLALGIKNALLIGVIIGVTDMVPYFGPIIGAIPAAIIVLMQGWVKMLVFVIFIFVLQQFDGNYLGPKLMGDKLGLNSLLIIVAVIVMSGVLGVIGMFIGVPLFAILYMFFSEDVSKRLENKGKSTKSSDYL